MPDSVDVGKCIDMRDHGGKPVGPFSRSLVIGNQVLPHFDQDMGEALRGRMPVHGVVLERAVIRFVIADRQVRVFTQQRQKRLYGSVVLVPEKADLPGTGLVLPARRKGMDRNDEGRSPLSAATRSLARATAS